MEIRRIFEERYPMMNSAFLAWCYAFDKNPMLPFGGDENNLSYIIWMQNNPDYWITAQQQKGIPYEEIHRDSIGISKG